MRNVALHAHFNQVPVRMQVQTAYAAMSQLNRELLALQQSQSEFGAALEAVGTRGELLEVKRRLEGHQVRGMYVSRYLPAHKGCAVPSMRSDRLIVNNWDIA